MKKKWSTALLEGLATGFLLGLLVAPLSTLIPHMMLRSFVITVVMVVYCSLSWNRYHSA
jgi:hypothetical protein